jgi:hypothetical protein
MSTNIDFNALWQKQETATPNWEDVIQKAEMYKRKKNRKLIYLNLILFITSAFIIGIWIYYQPQFITTKIGITLTILAMIIFIIGSNKTRFLKKEETITEKNASTYLEELIDYKQKQKLIQGKLLTIYFVLLSVGIGLYLYEYASMGSKLFFILTYSFTFLWIAFNWLYLRPKQIQKQEKEMNNLIESLTEIQKQIK